MTDRPIDPFSDRAAIATFFDDMSGTRNELFRTNPVLDHEQHIRSTAVLAALTPRRGDRVLDIGCGNARDIIPLLKAGAVVTGVDLSPGMIEQARRDLAAAGYGEVALEVGDASRLRFADASFDKVLCSEVIEHIPDADAAIAEMARVLRPGGVLVVSTPNRRSWYGFDRYVVWTTILRRRWNHPFDSWRTRPELRALLERHGLRTERVSTACYLPGFLLTYFLPRALQRLVVAATSTISPAAAAVAPGNGYLLVAFAIKP